MKFHNQGNFISSIYTSHFQKLSGYNLVDATSLIKNVWMMLKTIKDIVSKQTTLTTSIWCCIIAQNI